MTKKKKTDNDSVGGLSLIACYALAGVLSAQEPKTMIGESIVTVGKVTSKAILDEGKNTVSVDREQLEGRGYKDIGDALRQQPSVSVQSGGYWGDEIDMRGSAGVKNISVKILHNGAPLNVLDSSHGVPPISQINLEDVDNIDIIPGGGAVLYGSGTRGGVIIISTKGQPKDFLNVKTEVGAFDSTLKNGNFAGINVSGGTHASPNLFLKASAGIRNYAGYRYTDSMISYRGSLGMIAMIGEGSRLDVNLSADHNISKTSGETRMIDVFQTKSKGKTLLPTSYRTGPIRIVQDHSKEVMNEIQKHRRQGRNRDINDAKLTTLVAMTVEYTHASTGSGGQSQEFSMLGFLNASQMKIGKMGFRNLNSGLNTKFRTQNSSNTLIMGLDLGFYGHHMGFGMFQPNPNYIIADKTAAAVYAYDTMKFSRTGYVGFGARYEISEMKQKRSRYKFWPLLRMGIYHNVAFEIMPQLKLDNGTDVYTKLERGFISLAPNQLVMSWPGGHRPAERTTYHPSLKPETYETYEIGARSSTDNMHVQGAVFVTLTHNELIRAKPMINGQRWSGNYNEPLVGRAGVELSASQDFESMEFSQGVTVVGARLLDTTSHTKHLKGRPLKNIPEVNANISAGIYLVRNSAAQVKLISSNAYTGQKLIDDRTKMGGYYVGDLGLQYKAKSMILGFTVKNISNTLYFYKANNTSWLVAPGRHYTMDMKYMF